MDKIDALLHVLEVGIGLSVVFYWLGILLNRLNTSSGEFRWWLFRIVPQGIVLAAALKVFKLFS
jgi:hypothetical protein